MEIAVLMVRSNPVTRNAADRDVPRHIATVTVARAAGLQVIPGEAAPKPRVNAAPAATHRELVTKRRQQQRQPVRATKAAQTAAKPTVHRLVARQSV